MAEADIHKYYEAARTINNKTLLSTKKYIPDAGDRSNAGKLESTYQNIYKSDVRLLSSGFFSGTVRKKIIHASIDKHES
jgi:hypothetical protein